jgi:hypothetical protein
MKKNKFFLIFGASLILIGMLAFNPYLRVRSRDAGPSKNVGYTVLHDSNLKWIDWEMGSIVGKYGSLTAITDPGDLLAYRWLAMARYFIQHGPLATGLPTVTTTAIGQIDTAMARIVGQYGSLSAITDPGDLLAYRWLAMARFYEH